MHACRCQKSFEARATVAGSCELPFIGTEKKVTLWPLNYKNEQISKVSFKSNETNDRAKTLKSPPRAFERLIFKGNVGISGLVFM